MSVLSGGHMHVWVILLIYPQGCNSHKQSLDIGSWQICVLVVNNCSNWFGVCWSYVHVSYHFIISTGV